MFPPEVCHTKNLRELKHDGARLWCVFATQKPTQLRSHACTGGNRLYHLTWRLDSVPERSELQTSRTACNSRIHELDGGDPGRQEDG